VESELEDAPSDSTREQWSPGALEDSDRQKAEYLGSAREEILRACRALVDRWG
jgi:hypothetical protein